MESIHPSEIDLGLTRIQEVAKRLGIDSSSAKVITVAGTNGKGSCVATLEKFLCDHNCSVGAYTSPHIIEYNERIKINGFPVEDLELCQAFDKINLARDEITLTYFEFSTLAAYYIFQQKEIDYWLMEVGLGGRLDAVNIIDPDIAIITSIGIDHTEWLGSTREEIGAEKAGILRNGIAAICADEDPPESLKKSFKANDVKGYWIKSDFGYLLKSNHCDVYLTHIDTNQLALKKVSFHNLPKPKLPIPSVLAAFQALTILDFQYSEQYLAFHMKNSVLRGRFDQKECNSKRVVLDVAHNPAATKQLAKNLYNHQISGLNAIVVMMKNKQHRESFAPLLELVDFWHLVSLQDIERAEQPDNLKKVLLELGVSADRINIFNSSKAVFNTLFIDNNNTQDILAFGSFYLMGELYPLITHFENMSRQSN